LFANYLSQLANSKNLFSLKQDVKQTYFYQTLDNVPDVKSLLKEKKHEFIDEADLLGGISLSYHAGLPQLVKAKDNYTDRRNRFLDYLLAIHGESYTQYSLSQFNYYFNEEEFERHLIQNKTRLLKSLSGINKNRARAFNYLEQSLNTDNITGMEAKISILLGLGVKTSDQVMGYNAHSLIGHYKEYGLSLMDENASEEEISVWDEEAKIDESWSEEFIEGTFDFIDTEEIDQNAFSEEERKNLLRNTLPFRSNSILSAFLKDGISITNYQVGKVNENEEDRYYAIFKAPDQNWQKIGSFSSFNEANTAVIELVNVIKELNIQSEGLHILEHILLRPDLVDHNHGVLIYDENRKPFLRSAKQYSFEEREKLIQEIKPHLNEFSNYSVEATRDKDFEVHFKTPDDKYHFVSIEANISVEETHEKMESLFKFMSDEIKIVPLEKKVGLYVKNTHSGKIIPEDFYSYRVSVMLPTWTARFSNKEFRSIVEDTIHEQKPANIALNCYWLSPSQLDQFEKVYYQWMNEMRNPEANDELMDDLNNQLSDLLVTFKDNCNP